MKVGQRAGATDTGRKRRHNEDSYVLQPPLFAVADGMGGAQAGEVASELAVEALRGGGSGGGGAEILDALIQEANRRVHERSLEGPDVSGMGTTITAALVYGDVVWIGHVGDSRAYLLRDGELEQLTHDHSLVGEMVRSGKLSAEEAQTHPQRSVITRAVGTDPDVDVDTFPIEPREGDVFLICSDGLTDMVDDRSILATVEEHRGDLEAAARALVKTANRGGGEDNITVVLFEVGGEDASADETVALPHAAVAPRDEVGGDDEDTLSELDRVERPQAVDTMVVPPAQAAEMFATEPEEPAAGPSSRVLRVLALIALVLVLIALLLWALGR